MGGQSSSSIEVAAQSERGFNGAVWKGDLIVEVRGHLRIAVQYGRVTVWKSDHVVGIQMNSAQHHIERKIACNSH